MLALFFTSRFFVVSCFFFFFSSRRRHTRSLCDWSSDVCSSDLDCERHIIVDMLEKCNWNQTDAAERFHVPLSTLNQKIKRLNIEIKKKGRQSRLKLSLTAESFIHLCYSSAYLPPMELTSPTEFARE